MKPCNKTKNNLLKKKNEVANLHLHYQWMREVILEKKSDSLAHIFNCTLKNKGGQQLIFLS